MKKVVLVQLPIPQLNFGVKTGNIPLGAACLKNAAFGLPVDIELIPESVVSYISDEALFRLLMAKKPDIAGFTLYAWNVDRSMYLAEKLKKGIGSKIVFGGPEVTSDNGRIKKDLADFLVFGEGEAAFIKLLKDDFVWEKGCCSECSESVFENIGSPYLLNFLEPEIEDMMLLETQRGCPYSCGYCYYSKSRKKLSFANSNGLVDGFEWALEKGLSEIFLLDPSLDARKGLKELLKIFAGINSEKKISINSEIRADMITRELADLLELSGFTGFEMGLQTINPEPLRIMNRKTDLARFLQGVNLVKERGITPSIDLIIGLPGDTPEGFRRSVDFVEKHGFQDDIQIFPLSVLPGTDFRMNSLALGLKYEPDPPYTIKSSAGFTEDDLLGCLEYAEDAFDVSIYSLPDIDASWHQGDREFKDRLICLGGKEYAWKIMIDDRRGIDEIAALAGRLTHPYQIFVTPFTKNIDKLYKAVSILTSENPFTPFEIVFISPSADPNVQAILDSCNLMRPHFLDNDLRFLYGDSGNRSFSVTLVSERSGEIFEGDLCRHVFLWTHEVLPDNLDEFSDYDGVMIDSMASPESIFEWQNRFAPDSADLPVIIFSNMIHQRRWILLTNPKNYSGFILNSAF